MLRCGRATLSRLAARRPPPQQLSRCRGGAAAPRRAYTPTTAGTDVRFRIPPAYVRDEDILTVDDQDIEQRRDTSHATRLVQARVALFGLRSAVRCCRRFAARRTPRGACTALQPVRRRCSVTLARQQPQPRSLSR
jgi:hypothetical protein